MGCIEGRLPLEDVLTVLRRHDVSITTEPASDGTVCYTLVSDEVAERSRRFNFFPIRWAA
ncbi:hypothetical protein CCR95_23320 [Thiocystis minor]|nr:hypothetical protein [Thiocystis minor]